jgi:tetratricopeptide (TPR) repeat protein
MRYILLLLLSVWSAESAVAATLPDKEKKKKKGKTKTEAPPKGDKADLAKLERLQLDAEKAKVIEDWELALSSYKELLIQDPNNANAYYQIGQIYFNTGKLDEASKAIQVAAKLDPTNKWYLESLADIFMNQGNAKAATETFKLLVEKFPNNPEYYLNLGFLYAKQTQYDEAIKTYEQFEKNFGIDEQVIDEKKNLYLRLNKFENAIAEIKKLQEAYPDETSFVLQEADLYRANRMKEKALEVYKRVLALEPDNPQAQLGVTSLSLQGGSEQQNTENLKSVFDNPKVNVDTKIGILLLRYIQTNSENPAKRKEAIELAEILALQHPTDAKAHAIKGDIYYLDEQNDKALAAYQQALTLNKDVFQVWQQVMVIYNTKRDWSNVIKTSTSAMELFPNQPMIYLFRGGAETQLKEYEKAIKSLTKGERMALDNDKLRAQFLANMGDAYHSLKKHTESDSSYDKALRLDPENAYVLNNYSYYLSLRKTNLEKAKQMSAYANKLEPDNSSFLDTYAWILFELKDYKGAKEWQEKAMKSGGAQSGTILEHYGDILSQLGDKTQALDYWKKAKELGVDSSTIERKIAEGKYVE